MLTMRFPAARRVAACLAVLSLLLVAACTPTAARTPAGARPNIVFVLTDDLSTDLLPYMPHVAALMHQGTSFSHYYVVDSLCCPSRSAIFTGEYPHDDGVFTNHDADGGYAAFNAHRNQDRTFAVALHRAGYRTALMGKYLNGYADSDPVPPGWDTWDVTGDGYGEYDYTLNENGIDIDHGHRPQDYLTDVLGDRADAFVDSAAHDGSPFALEGRIVRAAPAGHARAARSRLVPDRPRAAGSGVGHGAQRPAELDVATASALAGRCRADRSRLPQAGRVGAGRRRRRRPAREPAAREP